MGIDSLRGWHLIVLGGLLLLSPIALNAVPLGDYTHHYNVGYIEENDSGHDVSGQIITTPWDDDILCWNSMSRACQLERTLLEDTVAVDTDIYYYDRFTEYSYVYANETFYDLENTGREISLQAVNQSTVFERTSVGSRSLPETVRTALEDGQPRVSARTELPESSLIDVQDRRYATLQHEYRSQRYVDSIYDSVRPFLAVLAPLVGFVLVLRGQRWRVR